MDVIQSPWRKDFPALQHNQKADQSLAYLDTAASALKPEMVIESQAAFYRKDYANIHRGLYDLSGRASDAYEKVRQIAADFIHAASAKEIIFTRNGTEGFNLLASCLLGNKIQAGSEIILNPMEHHANLVPWQVACEKIGATLKFIPLTESGDLDIDAYAELLSDKTAVVSVTAVSNVLGTVNPIKKIIALAREKSNAYVAVDAAQAAPHQIIDVQDWDCDFLSISGHKCYGPSGASFLFGKERILEALPPYQTGGGMIYEVFLDRSTYAPIPGRFEAGTPAIAEVVALGAALLYLKEIGMTKIHAYEQKLLQQLEDALRALPFISVAGVPKERAALVSFNITDVHPHDVASLLNDNNVAVRAGHHCTMPLHKELGLAATVRASLGLYNNSDDILALIKALKKVAKLFGVG
jgi:cysteine desulfurase/selenocysteine lyase